MGAWGVGITQDDTILDLIEDFKDSLKETKNIEITTKLLLENNSDLIEDDDEGPLFWIALANFNCSLQKIEFNFINVPSLHRT